MKRFSPQSMALLVLPCLFLALLGWALSRLTALPPASVPAHIAVINNERRAPTPYQWNRGSRVSAFLNLDSKPQRLPHSQWNIRSRVEAEGVVLWDSLRGDGARKIERNVFRGAQLHRYDFDLRSIPASWGEITLIWDAQLTQKQFRELPFKNIELEPLITRRSGYITLRKRGETLNFSSKISRNPHLRFLDWEILVESDDSESTIYRVRFFVQRDSIPLDSQRDLFQCEMALNASPQTPGNSGLSAAGDFLRDLYGNRGAEAEKSEMLSSFSHTFKVWHGLSPVISGHVDAKFSFQENWPLRASIPFSDSKGRVLLRKSPVKMAGVWAS